MRPSSRSSPRSAAPLDEVQDLALRRGYLDPFAHPDVRRQVQTALRARGRGAVARREKGVYEVVADEA